MQQGSDRAAQVNAEGQPAAGVLERGWGVVDAVRHPQRVEEEETADTDQAVRDAQAKDVDIADSSPHTPTAQ